MYWINIHFNFFEIAFAFSDKLLCNEDSLTYIVDFDAYNGNVKENRHRNWDSGEPWRVQAIVWGPFKRRAAIIFFQNAARSAFRSTLHTAEKACSGKRMTNEGCCSMQQREPRSERLEGPCAGHFGSFRRWKNRKERLEKNTSEQLRLRTAIEFDGERKRVFYPL